MLRDYIYFECRYFFRQPSFYIIAAIFFLLAFFDTAVEGFSLAGIGNYLKNGPYAIAQMQLFMGLFGIFLAVNFVGSTAIRNHAFMMEQLIYSKPLKPMQYQLGRFLGAFLVVAIVFAFAPLGHIIGSLMWWVNPERIGSIHFNTYIFVYVLFALPTLFLTSAFFYTIASKYKSMMALYVTAVALFFLYLFSNRFASEPEYRAMAALIDPFGLNALGEITRYWTSSEKNTNSIELAGVLLQNRMLCLLMGISVFMFLAKGFRMPLMARINYKKVKQQKLSDNTLKKFNFKEPNTSPKFLQQLMSRTRFECNQVIISAPFMVLVLITTIQLLIRLNNNFEGLYGAHSLPITQIMISTIQNISGFFIYIVLTYYSAEIVWRERNIGIGDVMDSLPVRNIIYWSSKLIAMIAVVTLIYVVCAAITIAYQFFNGVNNIELMQYFISLTYFTLLPWCMTAVVAFAIQVICPNKYVGMLVFILFIAFSVSLNQLGFNHSMFHFSKSPASIYSDMNEYGWSLLTHSWYMLYWSGFSLVLFVLGYGLFHRGHMQSLKERIILLNHNLGHSGKIAIVVGLSTFFLAGSFIYYNTVVLNNFTTKNERVENQVNYEKEFKKFKDLPVLSVIKTGAYIDIFPEERRINSRFEMTYENRSSQPIVKLLVLLPEHTPQITFDIPNATLSEINPQLRTAWLDFSVPVQPGDILQGTIIFSRESHGFRDGGDDIKVVENGTFIDANSLLPHFGYLNSIELDDNYERAKYGLPAKESTNRLEDERYYANSIFGSNNYIDFEAVISTSLDQVALASGTLQKEWIEHGRRYFHYKENQPIINSYAFLSARLAVKKEVYNGVELAVYHHPEHSWNVDRMLAGMRDSLEYYSNSFGSYQYNQLQVVEFPQYTQFAQSFPNTIAYSESAGFIIDASKAADLDLNYYITAHEVAHQWWGHQIIPADVEGAPVITEMLAQYSAISVMEKKYGTDRIRPFLKRELDNYLSGRANNISDEVPLLRSTPNKSYIHYNKGSLVIYAIKDFIGEAKLNENLAAFLQSFQYQTNRYPTTLDLLSFIKRNTNQDEQKFINDLFTKISLYDLSIEEVTVSEVAPNQFEISLDVNAKYLFADGKGIEAEQPMDQMVDIGVFDKDPNDASDGKKILSLQKFRVKTGKNHFTILVSEKPNFICVDPLVKLIDRDINNNIKKL